MAQKLKVLFVCVHNAGRSQMAAAFARQLGADVLDADCAGTMPTNNVNPVVVQAMAEKSIDLRGAKPTMLTKPMVKWADKVFTMGCSVEEACPAVFVPSEDWKLDDPAGQPIEKVRVIRDQVEAHVKQLIVQVRSRQGAVRA